MCAIRLHWRRIEFGGTGNDSVISIGRNIYLFEEKSVQKTITTNCLTWIICWIWILMWSICSAYATHPAPSTHTLTDTHKHTRTTVILLADVPITTFHLDAFAIRKGNEKWFDTFILCLLVFYRLRSSLSSSMYSCSYIRLYYKRTLQTQFARIGLELDTYTIIRWFQ